jgi:hypothetical protein
MAPRVVVTLLGLCRTVPPPHQARDALDDARLVVHHLIARPPSAAVQYLRPAECHKRILGHLRFELEVRCKHLYWD